MKPPEFTVRPYHSAARPHLKWQVVGKINGKRSRRFFKTQAEAKQYAYLRRIELNQHGSQAAQLSTYHRLVAQRCLEQLAPYGISLEEATQATIDREKMRRNSCAIEAVCDQFIQSLITRRIKKWTINAHRRQAKRLCSAFPGKLICDITTQDLEYFLTKNGAKWKASSRNQHRGQLNSLWAFAHRHGYCSEKIARQVEWLRETERTIGIVQPAVAARLLALAPPKLIVGLAIGFFAGLRPSEICRLDWRQIDLRKEPDPETGGYGFIHVLPENAKTARNRFVTILPNLAAWLRPFQKENGKVVIAGDTQYFDELRQDVCTQAGITDFPNNGMRHSYASYYLAGFRKLSNLIVEMGHVGPSQIFDHYRALVRPDKASEYWQIAPFSRSELAKIHALSPEAYPWCRKVGRVIEGGEWIDGVKNLAHYFGVDYRLPYHWFENLPDCPPRPSDDRFHIPTWQKFVRSHPHWKSNCDGECRLLFYVSWYCGDRGGERRKYFATETEALAYADAQNRHLMANELRMDEVRNVVEFKSSALSDGSVQLQSQLQTSGSANIAG